MMCLAFSQEITREKLDMAKDRINASAPSEMKIFITGMSNAEDYSM